MATYSTRYPTVDLLRKRFKAGNGGYTYQTPEKTYFVSSLERDAFVSRFEKVAGICGNLIVGWCAIGVVWYAAIEFGPVGTALPALPLSSPGQTFMLVLALPILYNWWAFLAPGRALAKTHVPIASIPDDAGRLRKLQRITTVDFMLIAAVSCAVPTALADYLGVPPVSPTRDALWGVPIAVIIFAIGWSVMRWRVSRRVRRAARS